MNEPSFDIFSQIIRMFRKRDAENPREKLNGLFNLLEKREQKRNQLIAKSNLQIRDDMEH